MQLNKMFLKTCHQREFQELTVNYCSVIPTPEMHMAAMLVFLLMGT